MKAATHTARAIPRQTMTKYLQFTIQLVIMFLGNQDKGGFSPSFNIRGVQDGAPQTERKGGMKMVTYSDIIQTCILLVTLVGLCYQVFHDRDKKK